MSEVFYRVNHIGSGKEITFSEAQWAKIVAKGWRLRYTVPQKLTYQTKQAAKPVVVAEEIVKEAPKRAAKKNEKD